MLVNIYKGLWAGLIMLTAILIVSGYFTAGVAFVVGTVYFGMIFMGMMFVLPFSISHTTMDIEEPKLAVGKNAETGLKWTAPDMAVRQLKYH